MNKFQMLTIPIFCSMVLLYNPATHSEISSTNPLKIFGYGIVECIAYTPDAGTFLSGSSNGKILLWDSNTGEVMRIFSGHTDAVTAIEVSSDGLKMVSGSDDDQVILWNIATGEQIRKFTGMRVSVNSVTFSPDNSKILGADRDGAVILWDANSGNVVRKFSDNEWAVKVAFFSNGSKVFSGASDSIKIWEANTGTQLQSFATNSRKNIEFYDISADGSKIIGGSRSSPLSLWNANTGELLNTFKDIGSITSVAFSPDSSKIVTGNTFGKIQYWDESTGNMIKTSSLDFDYIEAFRFSADGSRILAECYMNVIRTVDVKSDALLKTFFGHTGSVRKVSISPDGKELFTGHWVDYCRVWDINPGTIDKMYTLTSVTSGEFSPKKSHILVPKNKNAWLFDASSGETIKEFSGHTGEVTYVSFSPDGSRICTIARDSTVRIWNTESASAIKIFKDTGYVYEADISPDNSKILVGYNNKAILYNILNGEALKTFRSTNYNYALEQAFSADGSKVYVQNTNTSITEWDANTGDSIRTFKVSGSVMEIAVSPDGALLLVGTSNHSAYLYSISNGTVVKTLSCHTDMITSVAYAADGETVALGSDDGTASIWDVTKVSPIRQDLRTALKKRTISYQIKDDNTLILSPGFKRGVFSVYTISGKQILKMNFQNNNGENLCCKLPHTCRKGTYLFTIENGNETFRDSFLILN